MKLALFVALFTSTNITHLLPTPFTPSVDTREILGMNSSDAFGYEGESFPYYEKKIHFSNGDGYFVRYKKTMVHC